MHHLAIRATRVEGVLLDSLDGFKGVSGPLGVRCLPEARLHIDEGCLGHNDGLSILTALDIALIGMLVKWCRW
jgi:hypothetical protein